MAGLTTYLPFGGPGLVGQFQIEGRPPFEPGKDPIIALNFISPGFFQAMGIEIRAGRPFASQDGDQAPNVTIINETMAQRFFSNEDPIGHRLVAEPPLTLVGVVGDTHLHGIDQDARLEVYVPYTQNLNGWRILRLVVRAASGLNNPANPSAMANLATSIRSQVRARDPNEPVSQVVTMDELLSNSVAGRRFQMLLLSVFATLALVIAAVGIYGVISYAVSQRTHEIGIRMALGARCADVLWMMVWRGMHLTLIGVVLGLTAAFALTRVLRSLLFEVSPTDPMIFSLIAILLIGVALIASYIPARRATKIDPLRALRHE